MKYTVFVGLQDKDLKEQVVDTADAFNTVVEDCCEAVGGATITKCSGVYRYDDGKIAVETTLKVEIYTDDERAVLRLADRFKSRFNQESVGLVKTDEDIEYV